jgi:hypothetical protein
MSIELIYIQKFCRDQCRDHCQVISQQSICRAEQHRSSDQRVGRRRTAPSALRVFGSASTILRNRFASDRGTALNNPRATSSSIAMLGKIAWFQEQPAKPSDGRTVVKIRHVVVMPVVRPRYGNSALESKRSIRHS